MVTITVTVEEYIKIWIIYCDKQNNHNPRLLPAMTSSVHAGEEGTITVMHG